MSRKNWLVLLCVSCIMSWGTPALAAVTEVTAQQLKGMMEKEKVVVINPLSSIEFNDLHITGSVNIDIDELDKLPADKATKLVFYCLGRQ